MTTARMRTPRRAKAWAVQNFPVPSGTASLVTGIQVVSDLLAEYRSEMGISNTDRVTAMRIIGRLGIFDAGGSTAPGAGQVDLGIAWIPNELATAAAGNTRIPVPVEDGLREAQWLWTQTLFYSCPNSSGVILPAATSTDEWMCDVDITQMRKQPSPDFKLCLIAQVQDATNQQIGLGGALSTMIALS